MEDLGRSGHHSSELSSLSTSTTSACMSVCLSVSFISFVCHPVRLFFAYLALISYRRNQNFYLPTYLPTCLPVISLRSHLKVLKKRPKSSFFMSIVLVDVETLFFLSLSPCLHDFVYLFHFKSYNLIVFITFFLFFFFVSTSSLFI